jgi:hydroxymethylbilane synthase
MQLQIGARGSALSQKQAWEVLGELKKFHPEVDFIPFWIKTTGDADRTTSLRSLDKTNFFTKEIDEMQLAGHFRISIHSAKDLPEPLDPGLCVACLTKGQDPKDVLVLRKGHNTEGKTVVATSSLRREEEVKKILPHAEIVDIRGTIEERLAAIEQKTVDGVVIAKAALIRLGITPEYEIELSGPVALYQGQLAVVARRDDIEMKNLFSCLDVREKVLYLGLEAPQGIDKSYLHCPLIKICPKTIPPVPEGVTHIIMTSKTAVRYFKPTPEYHYLSVGKATTNELLSFGCDNVLTATVESQEGIIELIKTLSHPNPIFFWPHSSRSRPLLHTFCKENNFHLIGCELYDTLFKKPAVEIDFETLDAIYFSSPSTVDAFFTFFDALPNKKIITQGKITEDYLSLKTMY